MADNFLGKSGAEPVNIHIQVGDSIRMSDEDLIRLRGGMPVVGSCPRPVSSFGRGMITTPSRMESQRSHRILDGLRIASTGKPATCTDMSGSPTFNKPSSARSSRPSTISTERTQDVSSVFRLAEAEANRLVRG
jgi:hypothetical protein